MRNEIKIFLKDGTIIIFESSALLLGKSFATVEFNEDKNGNFERKSMYDLERVDAITVITHKESK